MDYKTILGKKLATGIRLAEMGKPFRLSSGSFSRILLDLSIPLRRSGCQDVLRLCIDDCIHVGEYDSVGGMLNGADLVSSVFIHNVWLQKSFGVRKEPKGRGLDRQYITGNLSPGDSVLLVDDVMTTGSNTIEAGIRVQEAGGIISDAFCIVDRGGLKDVSNKFNCDGYRLFTLKEITALSHDPEIRRFGEDNL